MDHHQVSFFASVTGTSDIYGDTIIIMESVYSAAPTDCLLDQSADACIPFPPI
ncbi:hypothetical protein B4166_2758 [Caldibacillus thermoamylovorans]|uniref:Uncharacterized protein n=1 Tax=Caldibacillus thermoamylovorans TaxID=35841 RepID=A0ABD4A5A7_9BACI|nr:hypothetical protein B4166_2758 [Caldibacillus thermoamylovorans]KIO72018.1 hypothetical protein B4167_3200 [Caldibacillus thermoamylovorans]